MSVAKEIAIEMNIEPKSNEIVFIRRNKKKYYENIGNEVMKTLRRPLKQTIFCV